jgi:hypothetical protein
MLHFDDFSISKREILISVAIIAVMIIIGLMIHGSIDDALMLKYQEYNLALQVNNNKDMFEHAMNTNIGNAFVYGNLECVDTVTFDEIGGEYSYVEKVKERYTRHTRVVTKTRTVNGKTQTYTDTEVYYTWDRVDSWNKHCNKITFMDVEFDYGTIQFPSASHITTIKESSKIRYVYYGSPVKATGTTYAELRNGTVNNAKFYVDRTITETIEQLETRWQLVLFWIGWVVLTGGVVFGFVYIDNHWLEDKSNTRRRYGRYYH